MADQPIRVYVGDELAAIAEPITLSLQGEPEEAFYFLTIQSDNLGAPLRFELNGETLMPFDISTSRYLDIPNEADSHHGSLKAPVLLRPADDNAVYKILEDNHVVIIRNNEKYDVTGKKLK